MGREEKRRADKAKTTDSFTHSLTTTTSNYMAQVDISSTRARPSQSK